MPSPFPGMERYLEGSLWTTLHFTLAAEERPITLVWPITLEQPLPTVPIPLLPGNAGIFLDLQAAFPAAYDLLGYDLLVDYTTTPDVPLSKQEKELIHGKQ